MVALFPYLPAKPATELGPLAMLVQHVQDPVALDFGHSFEMPGEVRVDKPKPGIGSMDAGA